MPDPRALRLPDGPVGLSRLDWSEPTCAPHDRLLAWYRTLIALRRERTELGDPRLDLVEVTHDVEAATVVVRRGTHLVMVNLAVDERSIAVDPDVPLEVVAAWDSDGTQLETGQVSLPAYAAAILAPPA